MPALDLLLGPPGTGKTTALVAAVERALGTGAAHPDTVAFVSFTNAAAEQAIARLDPSATFPHCRTIHSLAFRALGLARGDVLDRSALARFADVHGEPLTLAREPGLRAATPADAYFAVLEFARATGRALDDVWAERDEHVPGTTLAECIAFAEAYRAFKTAEGLLDFTDMLTRYAEHGTPLPVQYAVVDEAQDLTHWQWAVVRRAFANADTLLVAGDDDQAIYTWAGADVTAFLALGAEAARVRVLAQSHRLPERVWQVATEQVRRIGRRYAKDFRPRDRVRGTVQHHATLDSVDLSGSDVMVLARNAYLLDRAEERLRDLGIVYTREGRASVAADDVTAIKTWLTNDDVVAGGVLRDLCRALGRPAPSVTRHGRESLTAHGIDRSVPWPTAFAGWSRARRDYYVRVLRNGRKLSAAPTVALSTIHAAKGKEATEVVLLTDVSARTARHLHTDDEHRVWYVGLTRALDTLHIVQPGQSAGYWI